MQTESRRHKMKKRQVKVKASFADAYRTIKGFGTLPETEKSKVRINRFRQVLGKDK